MDYFDKLAGRLKNEWKNGVSRLKNYFKRLLFPLYLFPIKLITYSTFYTVKFAIKLVLALIGLIIDGIVYPFKSLKNFLKSLVTVFVFWYLAISFMVMIDYLTRQYGNLAKTICAYGYPVNGKLLDSVVRVVGGYSEGSGFFVADNQVMTSFHVIADEPSPKIIFPDGKFVTPIKIVGNKDVDLAILFTQDKYQDQVMPLPENINFLEDEPIIAGGYALGTELTGKATILKGRFVDFRKSKQMPIGYIQSDINLVEGMSGGPLVNQCGQVVGVNTMGLSGLSLFVDASWARRIIPEFTDQNIAKINVDPAKSPEDAVYAFYTYLKARNMEEGFKLLSREYLEKTNFEEWTNRFIDILDVDVIKSERFEKTKDTAFVKFSTKNWVDGEAEMHYYEGTWQTIKEDGVYKMLKSKITEVENPAWDWFYE